MDIKPRPHRRQYIELLRRMTPAQRLEKAFELTDYSRELLKQGLRNRHPHESEQGLRRMFLDRMRKCQNVNS